MSARDNILAKLRGSLQGTQPLADTFDEALVTEPWRWRRQTALPRFAALALLSAARTRLHSSGFF